MTVEPEPQPEPQPEPPARAPSPSPSPSPSPQPQLPARLRHFCTTTFRLTSRCKRDHWCILHLEVSQNFVIRPTSR